MKLVVTNSADKFLRDHLHLHPGDKVRFYSKEKPGHIHHGSQQCFVKGQSLEKPVAKVSKGGVDYYIDFEDDWFFSGLTTRVDYDPEQGIIFAFASEDRKADATTAVSKNFEDFWE